MEGIFLKPTYIGCLAPQTEGEERHNWSHGRLLRSLWTAEVSYKGEKSTEAALDFARLEHEAGARDRKLLARKHFVI